MSIFQLPLIDDNGVKYMSAKAAEGVWPGLSRQKIVAECTAGKVLGAKKDSSGKWIMPVDTRRPLGNEEIRKILIPLLCLKNKPDTNVDLPKKDILNAVLEYLRDTGYIEPYDNDEDIELTKLVLTEKGMHLATEGSKLNIDWVNAGITIIQIMGSIASIWGIAMH